MDCTAIFGRLHDRGDLGGGNLVLDEISEDFFGTGCDVVSFQNMNDGLVGWLGERVALNLFLLQDFEN